MGLNLNYREGQTPIDEDEKEGLLIKNVSTREDLDEFEQYNIEKAVEWSMKYKFKIDKILDEMFIKDLHRRMFNEVWRWADPQGRNFSVWGGSDILTFKFLAAIVVFPIF